MSRQLRLFREADPVEPPPHPEPVEGRGDAPAPGSRPGDLLFGHDREPPRVRLDGDDYGWRPLPHAPLSAAGGSLSMRFEVEPDVADLVMLLLACAASAGLLAAIATGVLP